MKKRVYIAYTGGTIGMNRTSSGYAPESGFLERLMRDMRELDHPSIPEYTIHEYQPLLDSSNMMPSDWRHIAEDIERNYDAYDGFVVLHGTDTMAYSASALAFFLEGLGKPVILTGSQIPLCEIRSDARDNLITTLIIASTYSIPEVCLFFGSRLLRGCRAVKVSAAGFEAFDSPNHPPLGVSGVEISIAWNYVRHVPEPSTLHVPRITHPVVGALRLFPGISASVVRNILQPPLQGLVLEAYGVGNAPVRDKEFLRVIEAASSRGVVIVDSTQCLHGSVDLDDYETGAALADAGVLSGYDMTAEAALTKLYYLLGRGLEVDAIRAEVGRNLRGELTKTGEM